MATDPHRSSRKGPLELAVMRDLRALAPTGTVPKYEGASLLARQLAAAIDGEPGMLKDLSPKLLATLSALGLTAKSVPTAAGQPAPTPTATGGGEGDGTGVPTLAERRERHRQAKAARAHGA